MLSPATAAHADAPLLKPLADFQKGQWQGSMVGGRRLGPMCVTAPDAMLTGGGPQSGCTFTVIEDGPSEAVVTYKCPTGRSGRTALRRDAGGLYTIDAQGIANNLPFGDRTEWRRLGNC